MANKTKNNSQTSRYKNSFSRLVGKRAFPKWYMLSALVILFASTCLWTLLGAHLQQQNADQLINAYLFDDSTTFQQALLPSQHSFLLKWPLFYAIRLLSYSSFGFSIITLFSVLITVGFLAYILYRIDKRPVVFGTMCLALASSLLLIPAQPYGGGLLPVNMAMVTTRNIEYIVYIAALVMIARTVRLRSISFISAAGLLGVLIASDKLFLSLGIGGALVALVMYSLLRKSAFIKLALTWLYASVIASIIAAIGLWVVKTAHVTQIVGQSEPYSLNHSIKELVLGTIYAIHGLLTNLGANPAFDATTLRGIPHAAVSRLFGISGLAYIINLLIATAVIYACYRVITATFKSPKQPIQLRTSQALATMLLWTAFAAVGAFIATNHYYAVDARYITIVLFAGFTSLATFLVTKQWKREQFVATGALLTLGVLVGVAGSIQTYHTEKKALDTISSRNQIVKQVVTSHKVNVLVGDYWRVTPIKQASQNHSLDIMPLQSCIENRGTLNSKAWQKNLKTHSFAYLLSLDHGLTDFPKCNVQQVTTAYGTPNSSVLVDGSYAQPKELLLFYDRGSKSNITTTESSNETDSTVFPVQLSDLDNTTCDQATIMNFVAHEDDDLLFINPDTLHDIQKGNCIRSVYVTAGDAGSDKLYWLGREQGTEAAYSSMLGLDDLWVERTVQLSTSEYIKIANPKGNTKVSLIFMHLPDGNLNGSGFSDSGHSSLEKLHNGVLPTIKAVDEQSSYSADGLRSALLELMTTYNPSEVRTQNPHAMEGGSDHSDHKTVGNFVTETYNTYVADTSRIPLLVPLKYYVGYQVENMPINVSDADLFAKQNAFFAYAKHDGAVCGSIDLCSHDTVYGHFLKRQYQVGG